MEHYVGIDVSLELSSVCVVDGRGKIVKEAKVASEPEALVYFFKCPINPRAVPVGKSYRISRWCSRASPAICTNSMLQPAPESSRQDWPSFRVASNFDAIE